jgi:hypothetical protein
MLSCTRGEIRATSTQETLEAFQFRIFYYTLVFFLKQLSMRMTLLGLLIRVILWNFTEVLEVIDASAIRASVNFYQPTWHKSPEDSHLHAVCSENLNSHS